MRLFIAIDLSADMKKAIVNTMHDLKVKGVKGSYAPAPNLHLTLCFIGETKEKERIVEAMKQIKYKPFKLTTAEFGNFGDTFYLGTKGGQAINGLAADIRKALKTEGIAFDESKFVPHITLIRKAVGANTKMSAPRLDMMVKKISIMKSESVKGKTVYTEIAAF